MRYIVVGAGALGSALAGYLSAAGKSVTLVARGDHLRAMQAGGLRLQTPSTGVPHEKPMRSALPKGTVVTIPIDARPEDQCNDAADVIFVTVKEYSLDKVIPLLDRLSEPGTIVIPLLNSLGAGDRIARTMRADAQVMEGVAYVGTERRNAGEVLHNVDFFRLVVGPRVGQGAADRLEAIAADIEQAGLTFEVSANMLKSTLTKLIRVAALSGAMLKFGGSAGDLAANPEAMTFLRALGEEIQEIAVVSGCPLDGDPVRDTIEMTARVDKSYRTSLKEDIDLGRPAEIQAQIIDIYEFGRRIGLPMSAYKTLCEAVGHSTGAS